MRDTCVAPLLVIAMMVASGCGGRGYTAYTTTADLTKRTSASAIEVYISSLDSVQVFEAEFPTGS